MLRNILHQSVASASAVFLLVLFVLAGRFLGAVDLGKLSLAFAIGFIFQAICDPGLYQVAIREIARDKDRVRIFLATIMGYKIVATTIFLLGVLLVSALMKLPSDTAYAILIVVFGEFLKSLKQTYSSAFHAYEYFHIDALVLNTERLMLLVAGGIILIKGGGLIEFCLVFPGVRIVDLLITASLFRLKISGIPLVLDFVFFRDLMKSALPVGAFLALLNLYTYTDTVMLSAFRGDAEVGWYNAAFKVYEGLAVFPMVICTAFRPRVAWSYQHDRSYFTELFAQGIKYVAIISLVVTVSAVLASADLIRILFGSSFEASVIPLKILSAGILFVFVLTYAQMMMIAMDYQRVVLWITGIALLLNIILNLILIPHYGLIGAASSTVAGELFVFVALLVILARINVPVPLFATLYKPTLLMILSLACVFWLLPASNYMYKIILVNLVFVASLLYFKVLNFQEFKLLDNFAASI